MRCHCGELIVQVQAADGDPIWIHVALAPGKDRIDHDAQPVREPNP